MKEPWFWIVAEIDPPAPRIDEVLSEISEFYRISRNDILSARRTAQVVRARQIAMYLAKTLTLKSLPQIGRILNRDHTSVLSGVRKIARLRVEDKSLADELDLIANKFGGMPA